MKQTIAGQNSDEKWAKAQEKKSLFFAYAVIALWAVPVGECRPLRK